MKLYNSLRGTALLLGGFGILYSHSLVKAGEENLSKLGMLTNICFQEGEILENSCFLEINEKDKLGSERRLYFTVGFEKRFGKVFVYSVSFNNEVWTQTTNGRTLRQTIVDDIHPSLDGIPDNFYGVNRDYEEKSHKSTERKIQRPSQEKMQNLFDKYLEEMASAFFDRRIT